MAAEPNYRRTKPGMRSSVPNSDGASGPSSQIPGLSQTANSGPVEKTKGRRVGIQATDSDYVKLAKQGGHRGLLSHDAEQGDVISPTAYKASEFFGDENDVSQSKRSSQRLVAPFGTDDCTSWNNDGGKDKKSPLDETTAEMSKIALSPEEIEEANKYKRLSHAKKTAAPVDMSRLLSFGYMEDEKKSPNDDASSLNSDQTSTVAPEEELE